MSVCKERTNALILTFACANTALYGLPLMKNQFYDTMLEALGLTNTQIGTIFSIYGIISMVSYLAGGILSDYVPVKKMLISALILSGILHFLSLITNNYYALCFIFGAVAITSVLMFYPASMKVLSSLQENGKGRVFGNYIVVIDIFGILAVGIGFLALLITDEAQSVFRAIVTLYAIMNFMAALLLDKYMIEGLSKSESRRIKAKEIKEVLKNSKVWFVSIIFFCNYLMIGSLTYVIPFLSDIYDMNSVGTTAISIIRVNILPIFAAYFGGILTDKIGSAIKFNKSMFISCAFVFLIIVLSFYFNVSASVVILVILTGSTLINSAKAVNMVIISDVGIPSKVMGTAIGIVTFLGYSSDAFFYALAGNVIDKWGSFGYEFIFLIFIICGVTGYITCRQMLVKDN